MEVLFKGPLNVVLESIKCNYVVYWSGDHGMDLVDKWTTEGKINDGNKETLNTYWTHFEEYIHPKTNKLIAVVELKQLFQGNLSLEDFHTKALRLVTQAGYEGDAKEKVLRDSIISGLTSDKIRAKIVKEGHEVTLNQVMEIARLEVSTQHHLERMQETAKVNYVQYGKSTKSKKGKKPQSSVQGQVAKGQAATGDPDPVENSTKDLLYHLTPATDVGKEDTQKAQDCKAVDATCRGCGNKGHYEKVFLKGKCSAHSLEAPQANSAGASEPLYFNDEGQPVYTYMVSVPHANKHLIKFPVALEPTTLRSNRNNVSSPQSTPSTVLLKADTGADINLMNRKTFNQLFGEAKEVLKPTPIKMEKLWKYCSKSVRDVPCFSQVERQGLQTIVLCDRL